MPINIYKKYPLIDVYGTQNTEAIVKVKSHENKAH